MRIPKGWVPGFSKKVMEDLLRDERIELKISKDLAIKLMAELMLEELMVEDRLNEEVREMLKQYDSEIEKGRLDYRKLFDMTKQKLLRERNIII